MISAIGFTISVVFSRVVQILKEIPIPATETFVMDSEKFILEDLDTIHVRADQAGAITVTISSVSTA